MEYKKPGITDQRVIRDLELCTQKAKAAKVPAKGTRKRLKPMCNLGQTICKPCTIIALLNRENGVNMRICKFSFNQPAKSATRPNAKKDSKARVKLP